MNVVDLRPEKIYITLNSESMELKYDLNAYAELEKKYGSVEVALSNLQKGSMDGIRYLLWAGLIHNHMEVDMRTGEIIQYTLSPFDVGAWIDPSQMQYVSENLAKAIVATLPKEAQEEAKKDLTSLSPAEKKD